MQLSAGKYRGFQRLADAGGRFKMVAIDQRTPLFGPIARKRGASDAPYDDVAAVKERLTERLSSRASAMLLDPLYAFPRVLPLMDPRPGLILSLEHSAVEETPEGRRSLNIPGWSVEKIRRTGADAVKVLVWYRHDAPEAVRMHQQEFVRAAGEACARADIVHLLEILVYPLPGEDPGTFSSRRSELVHGAVRDFLDPTFGVDIYKLESPARLADVPDPDGAEASGVQALYDRLAENLDRPWVLLSAGAGSEDFARALTYAYRAGASGYLCGRAIWASAFERFPDFAAMDRVLVDEALPYLDRINVLTDGLASPWPTRAGSEGAIRILDAGPGFPGAYAAP